MIILRKILIVLLLGGITACAELPGRGQPLSMWRVDSPTGVVFLLGTVHALRADHYPLADEYQAAFQRADRIAVEVNLLAVTPERMSRAIQRYGVYPPGETLVQHLPPDLLEMLTEHLAERELDLDDYLFMRPWLVAMQLTVRQLQALGFDSMLGVEMHFMQQVAGHREIREFESIEQQLGYLASDSQEVQVLSLQAALASADTLESELYGLIDAWEQGDLDGMHELSTHALDKYPGLEGQYYKLVNQRNLRMTRTIESWLDQPGETLVMVGALHLGGTAGILNQLKSRYTIHQIHSGDNLAHCCGRGRN